MCVASECVWRACGGGDDGVCARTCVRTHAHQPTPGIGTADGGCEGLVNLGVIFF